MHAEPASLRPSRTKWADLRVRVLSALVLLPLTVLAIWWGGWVFAILVALITVGLASEWLNLCGVPGQVVPTLPFAALPISVLLASGGLPVQALVLLCVATLGAGLVGGLTPARPVGFGLPYLGLGGVALVWLRGSPVGLGNVLGVLVVVWASDIGAYAVGRLVGGPKLAPAISPGKTLSGAIGGLLAAAVIGWLACLIVGSAHPGRSVAIALLIGLVAQLGDLFESRLKRQFGVKDSGSLIPGHGGLLDRLDAVLTAGPTAALLALVLGRGVALWE